MVISIVTIKNIYKIIIIITIKRKVYDLAMISQLPVARMCGLQLCDSCHSTWIMQTNIGYPTQIVYKLNNANKYTTYPKIQYSHESLKKPLYSLHIHLISQPEIWAGGGLELLALPR
jgi:hypothetical protein